MGVYVLIAVRNLIQARRRTLLLSVAIGLVTMLLVILLALSQGLQDTMMKNATTLAAGHVNVGGFFKISPSTVAPCVTEEAKVTKLIRENVPELDYLVSRVRGWAKISGTSTSIQAPLYGLDLQNERDFLKIIVPTKESEYRQGGRDEVLGEIRDVMKPNHILLFASQAKKLNVTVGDTVTISTETFGHQVNAIEAVVTAVARDVGFMSNWYPFLSNETLRNLYASSGDVTGAIQIYLKDIGDANGVMGRLRSVFEQNGFTLMDYQAAPFFMKFETVMGEDWTGQRLDLTIWSDEVSFLKWILTAFDSISYFLLAILTVIIGVGITNTMWIAVRERTREVGTLRAIGMSRRRVLAMFLLEAGLLGLFATTAGGLIGVALALVVDAAAFRVPSEAVRALLMSDTLQLALRPIHLAEAIAVFTMITALAALWPARRAAKMEPVKAIQHTG